MSERVHLHPFDTQRDLLDALSASIVCDLQQAIEEKGSAVLLVSGGSTPKPLFERLRQSDIDWGRVRIGVCDERWVSPDHEESNEKLVTTHLIRDHAANARFVGMYREGLSADDAEKECDKTFRTLLWPCDVAILGMGEDAHTASLFPLNEKLSSAFDLKNDSFCIAITPQSAPHQRMSLTLSALMQVKHLYLHFEGEKKRAVFEEAMMEGDRDAMPIRSLLHQEINDIEVYYA
ncbi:MAG: 6-phosphogluconolactonase [Sulfuricurvum sp.]|uniref:6-phosphogluconolactonase n=1 Tax=Sulfuricurvum sp. TaxID=2025608 RepID=UPI0025EB9678|nr:6-phosphogluconolactonase [Sulfuricurvum sp.]MCK9372194.1 6-phosphogluconolactonase [Sulfuricurvum sp.]